MYNISGSSSIVISEKLDNSVKTLHCRSHPISTMAQRVSEEHRTGVWIGGCGIWRGLWVTFGGGGALRAAFRVGVRWGVRMEGECGCVGDCWKGLGIGSTSKCLWNWEAVGVQRMPKVSEVGVGKTPQDSFGAENRSSPDITPPLACCILEAWEIREWKATEWIRRGAPGCAL